MTTRPSRPSSHPIIDTDEVIAGIDGIVTVSVSSYQLVAQIRPPIATQVVGAKRIGEGHGRWRIERWRKWAGGAFGEERDSGIEAEWQLRRPILDFKSHRRRSKRPPTFCAAAGAAP